MKAANLLLHCYAEKINSQWAAYCLDFTLAAQADTFEEAKQKLKEMVIEYVRDALVGEDQAYADQLLTRRAPWREWLTYYYVLLLYKLHKLKSGFYQLILEPIPLSPVNRQP